MNIIKKVKKELANVLRVESSHQIVWEKYNNLYMNGARVNEEHLTSEIVSWPNVALGMIKKRGDN